MAVALKRRYWLCLALVSVGLCMTGACNRAGRSEPDSKALVAADSLTARGRSSKIGRRRRRGRRQNSRANFGA